MSEVRLDRLVGPGFALLLAGGAALAYRASENSTAFFQSYLYGYVVVLCLTLGFLGIQTLHHTIRGSWGLAVLRIAEAASGPPMLLVLFVAALPILSPQGLHALYEWAHADALAADAVLQHKEKYLNPTFFSARIAAYFALWAFIAWRFRVSTARQDRTGDPAEAVRRTRVAAPGIVLFVLSLNFAVTDLVMSLAPHWSSTIYGPWFLVGSVLMALAFSTGIITLNHAREPYKKIVTPHLTRDLGNLMLAFTMLWAYFTLSQFLITYSGNLPEYISYYVDRRDGAWNLLGGINVGLQFFFVFLCLLSPRVKATYRLLFLVAAFVFVMRFSDWTWNIIPFFKRSVEWGDFAALAGFLGLWLTIFGLDIRRAPLLPAHDTRLEEAALNYEHA